jgi:hypothetical protein
VIHLSGAEIVHVERVLQPLGLNPQEAAEIASRSLPEVI